MCLRAIVRFSCQQLTSMERILDTFLTNIFPMLLMDKIDDVVKALIASGISNENDLGWVSEYDVKDILLPVQVPKLIGA